MYRLVSLILILFLVFPLRGITQDGAFEIIEGSVVLEDNSAISIGPATVIPEPWNRQLAIEILGYQEKIEKLEIDLNTEIKKFEIYKEATRNREDEIKEFMGDRYKAVYLENTILKGPWNKYGKVILWCAATAATVVLGTWFICRETDKYGC